MLKVARPPAAGPLHPLIPLFVLLLLSGCARIMIETPVVSEHTALPLFQDLAPELAGDRLPVLYATDRLPLRDEAGTVIGYTSQRSPSTVLGAAEVRIEPDDDAGSGPSSRAGLELAAVEELVRFPATPYLYRVEDGGRISIDAEIAAEIEQADRQARREIVERLALTPKKEVFVDIHGVATEFDQAVLSLADFWHFLGREGVPIAYTWPAAAKDWWSTPSTGSPASSRYST